MSYEEFPVFFPSGPWALSAIVCLPTEAQIREQGVVLLPSSAATRVHRNRMWVVAARELADRGYASIRVDYHGTGDSQGHATQFDLEQPFHEDVAAASAYFTSVTGVTSLVLVGTCYGSRCAVAAVNDIPNVSGMALLPTDLRAPGERTKLRLRTRVKLWVRKRAWLARLIQRDSVMKARKKVVDRSSPSSEAIQVSRSFEKTIAGFLKRGQVWFIYGDADKRYPQLQRCLEDLRPNLTGEQRGRLHVEVAPGRWLEKFHSLDDQAYSVAAAVRAVEAMTDGAAVGAPVGAPDGASVSPPGAPAEQRA